MAKRRRAEALIETEEDPQECVDGTVPLPVSCARSASDVSSGDASSETNEFESGPKPALSATHQRECAVRLAQMLLLACRERNEQIVAREVIRHEKIRYSQQHIIMPARPLGNRNVGQTILSAADQRAVTAAAAANKATHGRVRAAHSSERFSAPLEHLAPASDGKASGGSGGSRRLIPADDFRRRDASHLSPSRNRAAAGQDPAPSRYAHCHN